MPVAKITLTDVVLSIIPVSIQRKLRQQDSV